MRLFKKVKNLFKKPKPKKVEPPEVAKSAEVRRKPSVGGKKIGETYKVLKEPHISEKAAQLSDENKYTFKVFSQANKIEIKKAISNLYGVKVKDVNIIKIKPKTRILRGIEGTKTGYKKAVVTLEPGEKIEILPH